MSNTNITIKGLTGLSCVKNILNAKKGDFIKVDGRVGVVYSRSSHRGRNGYVGWTLNFGLEDDMWLSTNTLQGLKFEMPTALEALMFKTKLAVQERCTA